MRKNHRLMAVVDEATQRKVVKLAHSKGLTISKLLNSLIQSALFEVKEKNLEKPKHTSYGEIKNKKVSVRLCEMAYLELTYLAQKNSLSRSGYLSDLFYTHCQKRPALGSEELTALRQSTRELSALGRNVNQIARALNESPNHTDRALSFEFEQIKALLDIHRDFVKALIKSNLNKWGVDAS